MNNATQSTSELYARTHAALCAGRWSEARDLLDLLGQRDDNRDLLAPLSSYLAHLCRGPLPTGYAPVIQDRIDLVNAKAR